MSVNNRTLDPSEQKKNINVNLGATATGATAIALHVPFNCNLNAVQVSAFGLSGAPTVSLVNNRFIPGTGFTAITVAVGTSNAVPAYGTSGVLAAGILLGASFTQLFANDVLMIVTGGSNAAVTGLGAVLVIQPIQDVKTFVGGLA